MDQFATIVADPPWPFDDHLPGPGRGSSKHYKLMDLEAIKNYVLPPMADDCRLFLWRVASMQEEALQVVRAWGFTPKSEIIWCKTTTHGKDHFGMGRQVRMSHEACIIAVRGRPQVLSRSVRSIFDAQYTKHSGKPEMFFDIVESFSSGPYCELFARRNRSGWTCLGDEIVSVRTGMIG